MSQGNGHSDTQWTVSSLRLVADFFRVPFETVKNWRRQGCPGEKGKWSLPDIHQWLMERQRRPKVGEASPGLEMYRVARGERERLRLEQEKGSLVREDRVIEKLRDFTRVLAGLGPSFNRHLCHRCRSEAVDLLNETVDDATSALGALEAGE